MRKIKKFFKDAMTGQDGESFDIARILWFQSTQVYMIITIYAIHKGSYVFDPLLWGSGIAALAGGFGASIYAKAGTEPHSMEIKTDRMTFKQAAGAPLPSDDGDDDPSGDDNDKGDNDKGDNDKGDNDKGDNDNDGGDDAGRSLPPPPPPPPKKTGKS